MQRLDDNIFVFAKTEWAVLLDWASRDETRSGLRGIALDEAFGRAWSTDGHRAVILHDTSAPKIEGPKPRMVSYTDATTLLKACPASGQIRIAGRHAEVRDRTDTKVCAIVLAENPAVPAPVDRVFAEIPVQRDPGPFVALSAQYLGAFSLIAKAVAKTGKGKTPRLIMKCGSDRDPVLFEADSADGGAWRFIIMPVAL